MKYLAPVAIWLYLLVTTVAEVALFYYGPGKFVVDIGIGLIAMINALVTALFLMDIRKESPAIQYLMLTPLALIMVLILTMLFAFAQ
jgi:hypothetical protein